VETQYLNPLLCLLDKMGKVVNWIATIFCFTLVVFYLIVIIGIFNLPANTHGPISLILWIGFILPPILLLTCGIFYLFLALKKKKTNVMVILSTILLFIAFVIWLLLLVFMTMRSGGIFGFHGGIGVLSAFLIFYGFPVYIGYPLLQFVLILIGFLTSKKLTTTPISTSF